MLRYISCNTKSEKIIKEILDSIELIDNHNELKLKHNYQLTGSKNKNKNR
ncbi:hypothetical protein [Halanaerobium praevalens]|nr:hypothetical protein [Halanaerobium praevalens]